MQGEYECSNKDVNQQEGYRGSDSQSQVKMGRPWGKQGPVQMGTGYIYMVRKNRQRRTGRPKAWLEDTFERIAGRHLSWAANNCSEWSRYNICKTSVPQSPQSQGESGYTSVCIDGSANPPEWNSKYQCDIAKNKKRTALFWAITQRVVVIPYWRFGTSYGFHVRE